MAELPAAYAYLNDISDQPRMIREALRLFGTKEQPGPGDNPVIKSWAAEVSTQMAHDYYADSVPWCGLFMAVVAKRAQKPLPPNPLWALNWAKFGEQAGQPMLGDTLVFIRPGGGHVGLYVGEDNGHFHVLGGNQSDQVCIRSIPRERLYAARRPIYNNAPPSMKVIRLASNGDVSIKEA